MSDEPITINARGRFEMTELPQYPAFLKSFRIMGMVLAGTMVVAVLLVAFIMPADIRPWGMPAVVVTCIGVWVYRFVLMHKQIAMRLADVLDDRFETTFEFSENGIRGWDLDGGEVIVETWSKWSRVVDVELEGDVLRLKYRSNIEQGIPRRFVKTDTEWQALLALAKRLAGNDNGDLPAMDEWVGIHGGGEITPKQLAEGVSTVARMEQSEQTQKIGVLTMMVVLLLILLALLGGAGSIIGMLGAMVIVVAVLLLLIPSIIPAIGRRAYAKQSVEERTARIVIGDEGVVLRQYDSMSRFSYNAVRMLFLPRKYIALRVRGGYTLVWPQSFFKTAEDWFAARLLLTRKLGQCGKCGYNLRGSGGERCPECGAVIEISTPTA